MNFSLIIFNSCSPIKDYLAYISAQDNINKGRKKITYKSNHTTLQNTLSLLKAMHFHKGGKQTLLWLSKRLFHPPFHLYQPMDSNLSNTKQNVWALKEHPTHPVRLFAFRTSSKAEINMYHWPALTVLKKRKVCRKNYTHKL